MGKTRGKCGKNVGNYRKVHGKMKNVENLGKWWNIGVGFHKALDITGKKHFL